MWIWFRVFSFEFFHILFNFSTFFPIEITSSVIIQFNIMIFFWFLFVQFCLNPIFQRKFGDFGSVLNLQLLFSLLVQFVWFTLPPDWINFENFIIFFVSIICNFQETRNSTLPLDLDEDSSSLQSQDTDKRKYAYFQLKTHMKQFDNQKCFIVLMIECSSGYANNINQNDTHLERINANYKWQKTSRATCAWSQINTSRKFIWCKWQRIWWP